LSVFLIARRLYDDREAGAPAGRRPLGRKNQHNPSVFHPQ
jgi:hypothetical protein